MKGVVTLLGFLVSLGHHVSATDYCQPGLCPAEYRHILCPPSLTSNGWATTSAYNEYCDGDCRIANSEIVKTVALREINRLRDQVAAGNHPLLPQASRMPMMGWDDELALIAQKFVSLCPYQEGHACLNTPTHRKITMLLYHTSIDRFYGYVSHLELFKLAMTQWRETEKFISAGDVARPTELFFKNNDFSVFINQKATKVGCSINYACSRSYRYVVCLFSTKGVPLQPVYDTGKAGSLCKNGRSPCYTSLCL